jgi:hypothetical protein
VVLSVLLLSTLTKIIHAADKFPYNTAEKKVIEFGWGEPNTVYMQSRIREMEKMPFDGVVFHARLMHHGKDEILSRQIFSEKRFSYRALTPALKALRNTKFKKFTDNFIRLNITPGTVDWFDNFESVIHNTSTLAKFVRAGGQRGILLDLEPYDHKLFSYQKLKYRDSTSFDSYASQVEMRGRQFMRAIKRKAPRARILLTFAYEQALKKSSDPTLDPYGLLPAFIDGMLSIADKRMRIINGYEGSYSYTEEKDFNWGYRQMKEVNLSKSKYPNKYRSLVSAGFGIWMDLYSNTKGWDTSNVYRNPRTPLDFQSAMVRALKRSDRYVWVYSQQPKWWEKENLPEEYVAALRNSR